MSEHIEATKKRLGLRTGGVDIRVGAREKTNARGTRTTLILPKKGKLQEFVKTKVEPELRRQILEGIEVINISIHDESASIDVNIDPRRGRYSTGGYPSYDTPIIKDQNPLYNALKLKAGQLRGAQGLIGVIVGDGGSRAVAGRKSHWSEVGAREIVNEFLRQYSSIHFVLILSVQEDNLIWPRAQPTQKRLTTLLVTTKTSSVPTQLEELLRTIVGEMPTPVTTPVNAAIRARESGFGWGYHGGHKMAGSKITVSARELMEVLAGRRSVQDMNEAHGWSTGAAHRPNTTVSPFERHLRAGCLPSSISVIKTGENDSDDWVEIEFGLPDPAITRFK